VTQLSIRRTVSDTTRPPVRRRPLLGGLHAFA
jgi:hypothetical protein